MTPKPLTPPDYDRCQAEIRQGHGAFMLGPAPRYERCKNKPTTIARETRPGPDGQTGAMSLCDTCLVPFRKLMPEGAATEHPIQHHPNPTQGAPS